MTVVDETPSTGASVPLVGPMDVESPPPPTDNDDVEDDKEGGEQFKTTTRTTTMATEEGEDNDAEAQGPSGDGGKRCNAATIKKVTIGLILLGIIIYAIVDSVTTQYIKTGFESFLGWIQENPVAGVFAFMAVYFVATIFFLPGSILTLGSGFVFASAFNLGAGVVLATVAVFCGAGSGALVAFLLGRYLLRGWVMTLTEKYPVFAAIDKALEEKGFRIMSLLRLSPIIPFNALNYIAGVTAVSFWSYAFALFAMLPGTILYVFLGATAGSLADSASGGSTSTVQIVTIVVGATFGILAIAATSYYAKKELNKITAQREAEGADGGGNEEGGGEGTNNDAAVVEEAPSVTMTTDAGGNNGGGGGGFEVAVN